MQAAMSSNELNLYGAFVNHARKYLEFGSGGSTIIASRKVRDLVVSVESSREWINAVDLAIKKEAASAPVHFEFVDIGPVGDWGSPVGESHRDQWSDYSLQVWSRQPASNFDTFFIDGRFRVCCFAESLLRAQSGSILMIHDYSSRNHYHIVEKMCRKIATCEDLSGFIKDHSSNCVMARDLADEFRFDSR